MVSKPYNVALDTRQLDVVVLDRPDDCSEVPLAKRIAQRFLGGAEVDGLAGNHLP
jgi:hypothetical protein